MLINRGILETKRALRVQISRSPFGGVSSEEQISA